MFGIILCAATAALGIFEFLGLYLFFAMQNESA
jgi:hypothetical protein